MTVSDVKNTPMGTDDDFARVIAELQDNNSRKISLFNIEISSDKNDKLIKSFPKDCKAEELVLAHTSIGNGELIKLLKAIEQNNLMPNLKSLHLWRNSVSEEIIPQFCKLVEKSQKLKSITLAESSINDVSVCKIAKSIGKNRGVSKVNLSCNKMTDIGANKFLSMLRDSSYDLRDVGFRDNKISDELKNKLAIAMKKKPIMLVNKEKMAKAGEMARIAYKSRKTK